MTRNFRSPLKNRSGVTLVELLIAAMIGSMTTLLVAGLLQHFMKSGKVLEERLAAAGEDMLGNKALWFDLRRSGMSFNFLNGQMDDSGRPFYDFLPDWTCATNCSRRVTLTRGQGSFVIALSVGGMAPPTPITPLTFYDMAAAPNFATHGTVTFNPTNFNATMAAIDPVTIPEKKMLTNGKLLRFYSPFYQRTHSFSGALDMTVPPRMLSFAGLVQGGNVVPFGLAEIGPQVRPDLGTAVTSVDKFFRFLPPVAGTGAFGLVVPFDLCKYSIKEKVIEGRNTGMWELVRETFNGVEFGHGRVIASPVKTLTFLRKTISVPSIQPSLEIEKKEYRKIMNIKESGP